MKIQKIEKFCRKVIVFVSLPMIHLTIDLPGEQIRRADPENLVRELWGRGCRPKKNGKGKF